MGAHRREISEKSRRVGDYPPTREENGNNTQTIVIPEFSFRASGVEMSGISAAKRACLPIGVPGGLFLLIGRVKQFRLAAQNFFANVVVKLRLVECFGLQ